MWNFEASTIETLDQIERTHILKALNAVQWNLMASAKLLGIARATLYRKMRKHGIRRE